MIRKNWIKWGLLVGGAATGVALLVLVASTEWLAALGGTPDGERLERMRASEQWDAEDEIFVNADRDMRAVRELSASTSAPFLVPLGVGAHLEHWNVPAERIREMDWWDETQIGELTVAATPSRHFSGRGVFDRFDTLWASWTFVGPTHRVFFSGDTGFFDGMADISETYGPFDIAMFEIGAFHLNWGQIHLGPEGALDAFEMMDAAMVVPIHWGTFDLGLHGWREPIRSFAAAAQARGHRWAAPAPGGSIEPGTKEPREPWWE